MQIIARRGALLILLVLGALAYTATAQTVISYFNKVRITSGAADALSVSGGISGASGGNVPVKNSPESIASAWSFLAPPMISNAISYLQLKESDQGSNEKDWLLLAENKTFSLRLCNEALSSCAAALNVARGTGNTVDAVTLTATSVNLTGATTMTGTAVVTGALSGGTVWGENAVIASDGSASIPGYEFLGNTSTGFYRDSSTGRIGWTLAGVHGGYLGAGQFEAERIVGAAGGAFGTGNINGGILQVGRNSSGSGAAGCVILTDRSGNFLYLYVGGGLLRYNISSEGCPTENNSNPHSGSAIGDQTSSAASKHLLGEPSNAEMLDAVLRTRVHRFSYRDGRYDAEVFTGIVTDESPWFGKDHGKALNEINGLGYTVGAIKALEARVRELEARLAARQ